MRTLKTLAAFGALLLVASGANASIIFSLHAQAPDDGDPDINVQLDMTLSEGQTVGVLGLSWLHPGTTGAAPGPVGIACGTQPQSGCSFTGMSFVGAAANNSNGDSWAWDGIPQAVGGVGGTTFANIGLFTLAPPAPGEYQVSVGVFEVYDGSLNPVPGDQITVNPYNFTVVPEPTTAALIGLGLMGLTLAGRRKA